MMPDKKWIFLDSYAGAELIVVKPMLEEANIEYIEKLCQEGELLRLYTSSPGIIGAEIWILPEDEEKAKKLLQEIE
jgi:hypothetical protein